MIRRRARCGPGAGHRSTGSAASSPSRAGIATSGRRHRAVLPRRGHGARRRPPPLLRVPPRRGAGVPGGAHRGRHDAVEPRRDRRAPRRGTPRRPPEAAAPAARLRPARQRDDRARADAFALRGEAILPWSPAGYGAPKPRPGGEVEVLTPPLTLAALHGGYAPLWHPTAAGPGPRRHR
jgi:hypothetical protein